MRIALVTGANRGIGFETCRQLAHKGMTVLLGSRDLEHAERGAERLREEGLEVYAAQLDVTDLDQIHTLHDWIAREHARLDVLVNNAGVYLDEGVSVFAVDEDTVRLTLEVNFYGPLHLCRAFVPMMRQQGYGRVVNVTSGYGSLQDMGGRIAAYKVSKVALNALTRIVADEVRDGNIKVNAVDPGWVRTDMGGSTATRGVDEAARDIVWAATLPADGPTGGAFYQGEPMAW